MKRKEKLEAILEVLESVASKLLPDLEFSSGTSHPDSVLDVVLLADQLKQRFAKREGAGSLQFVKMFDTVQVRMTGSSYMLSMDLNRENLDRVIEELQEMSASIEEYELDSEYGPTDP